jgi:hypothetical protein
MNLVGMIERGELPEMLSLYWLAGLACIVSNLRLYQHL